MDRDERKLMPFLLELNVKHLDLRISDDELYEIVSKDRLYLVDCHYLIKKGYDELWYSKNLNGYSVILVVSKDGNIELYDLFIDTLFKSGRNDTSTLRDLIPVVLETDAILDKINNYGYSMLSNEEKNYLDNISK
jgi:hypothetical protein